MQILILGYGDIGHRVAKQLVSTGAGVTGVCRTPDTKPRHPDINLIAADITNEQELYALFEQRWDHVIMTLTPAASGDDRYHQGYVVPCRHLQQVLAQQAHQPSIVYISSTGVYAQRDGEWIDEQSQTEPVSTSGKALLQAETLIRSLPGAHVILRCSGIYGDGRDFMLRQVAANSVQLRTSWTNRIHQDDVAGFIVHLITKVSDPHSVYLLNDDVPVRQYEIYQWLAQQMKVTLDGEINKSVGLRGSKRCQNKRMKDTGYSLQYPSYRKGYQAMLESLRLS